MKASRKRTLASIVRSILEKMEGETPLGEFVGRERERLVRAVLEKMERQNAILGFVETGRFSYADVKKGVDFYVVVMRRRRREVVELSVTGPRRVKDHLRRHPEIPVIGVKMNEKIPKVEEKVRAVLSSAANY
ncbi:MAG: hypothetical protein V1696_02735 [Candidatus Jorgensenbacteria bacterium]